jgi:hypothetical protein
MEGNIMMLKYWMISDFPKNQALSPLGEKAILAFHQAETHRPVTLDHRAWLRQAGAECTTQFISACVSSNEQTDQRTQTNA